MGSFVGYLQRIEVNFEDLLMMFFCNFTLLLCRNPVRMLLLLARNQTPGVTLWSFDATAAHPPSFELSLVNSVCVNIEN